MIVFESKKQRRLVVRLERGEELVASLAKLAKEEKIGSAWVRGAGSLAWAELTRHDQRRRRAEPPQRFESPCDVLTLEGSLSRGAPLLHVTLSRRTDNGVDLLGGQLVSGAVFQMELVIECFDDVRLERAMDDATGLAVWAGPPRDGVRAEPEADAEPARGPVTLSPTAASVVSASAAASSRVRRGTAARPEPVSRGLTEAHDEDDADDEEDEHQDALRGAPSSAPPPSGPSSGGVSWADVAAVSAAPAVAYSPPPRRERSEPVGSKPPPIPDKRQMYSSELDEPVPARGDFVQHRQFGLCKIDREDKDGGLVIRLPSGVRKTIKLDFMEVGQPFDEGGRRVFPIRPRKK